MPTPKRSAHEQHAESVSEQPPTSKAKVLGRQAQGLDGDRRVLRDRDHRRGGGRWLIRRVRDKEPTTASNSTSSEPKPETPTETIEPPTAAELEAQEKAEAEAAAQAARDAKVAEAKAKREQARAERAAAQQALIHEHSNEIDKAQETRTTPHSPALASSNSWEFEGFSTSDATFAVDFIRADWFEQAALKAKEYLDYTSFSESDSSTNWSSTASPRSRRSTGSGVRPMQRTQGVQRQPSLLVVPGETANHHDGELPVARGVRRRLGR